MRLRKSLGNEPRKGMDEVSEGPRSFGRQELQKLRISKFKEIT